VYDVTNPRSIEQLAQWRDEAVSKIDADIYFPIVVSGEFLYRILEYVERRLLDTKEWYESYPISFEVVLGSTAQLLFQGIAARGSSQGIRTLAFIQLATTVHRCIFGQPVAYICTQRRTQLRVCASVTLNQTTLSITST
jgi:hypothetical protein